MIPDPASLRQMAEVREDENRQFRQFLKGHPHLSSEEIDSLVFELEAKAWKHIDCTKCGNCCREMRPTLTKEDVTRLASHLAMSDEAFTAKYLDRNEVEPEIPWIMRVCPCPSLKDNCCSVYEHRPGNCRDYPYLHKPDLVFRTFSMIERLAVCPAVFEVWEGEHETGFRHRRRHQY